MNLRELIQSIIHAKSRGAPQTGAGQFGRAGGMQPGAPTKPIAGLRSGMGGPVSSRNYGAEVSATPTPQPVMPPAPPPQAMAQALRQAPPQVAAAPPMNLPQGQSIGADVESVPFNPAALDQGTPLEPPPPQMHEGTNPTLQGENYMGQEDMAAGPASGGQEPFLGTLPEVVVGEEGNTDPGSEEAAMGEMGKRLQEYTDTEGMQGDELEKALQAQSQRREQALIERFLRGERI